MSHWFETVWGRVFALEMSIPGIGYLAVVLLPIV